MDQRRTKHYITFILKFAIYMNSNSTSTFNDDKVSKLSNLNSIKIYWFQ